MIGNRKIISTVLIVVHFKIHGIRNEMATLPVLAQIRLLSTYLTDIIWAVQIQQMSNDDSPCIGICTLNENGICIGCERTLEEIHDAYLKSIGMKTDE